MPFTSSTSEEEAVAIGRKDWQRVRRGGRGKCFCVGEDDSEMPRISRRDAAEQLGLELDDDGSVEEAKIKKAYKKLALKYVEPGRGSGDENTQICFCEEYMGRRPHRPSVFCVVEAGVVCVSVVAQRRPCS